MSSIHELPEEILHHVLSYFVFTDPWKSMLFVCRKWREIVSIYAQERERAWKERVASLKDKLEKYSCLGEEVSYTTCATHLYETFYEIAQIPDEFFSINSIFRETIMTYGNAIRYYHSMPLKQLTGFLIRHRLKDELALLIICSLFMDAKDLNPQVVAMSIRQITHFGITSIWPVHMNADIIQTISTNLHNDTNLMLQTTALFSLSKLIHMDSIWNTFKDHDIMDDVVPENLIPSYAIFTMELQRANRIEIIAKYFSVNQLVDHYQNWNLWQRISVLQLIARNFHSVIDDREYDILIEFLMTLLVDMCDNRELIASNFGEFFGIVDVLGHFCIVSINDVLLGITLLTLLSNTMVLFQHDFPHLTDVVHGFLVKLRRLILFMKYDASSDPELVENFFPLWCDDNATKKRKTWFMKQLTCQQNVKSVNDELCELIKFEENSTIKQMAEEIAQRG